MNADYSTWDFTPIKTSGESEIKVPESVIIRLVDFLSALKDSRALEHRDALQALLPATDSCKNGSCGG